MARDDGAAGARGRGGAVVARAITVAIARALAIGAATTIGAAPGVARSEEAHAGGTLRACGDRDAAYTHGLGVDLETFAFVPCGRGGDADHAATVRLTNVADGVALAIDVIDDQVRLGGADPKRRDAVALGIVARGQPVDLALRRTKGGYEASRTIAWDELDRLVDDGTRLELVFHDDDGPNEPAEDLKVAIGLTAGKSCERAAEEHPQRVEMGRRGARDLTKEELGAPVRTSSWFDGCGLPDDAAADVCVAVLGGKALGATVAVAPRDAKVALCIDRAARKIRFPASDKLDLVRQKF